MFSKGTYTPSCARSLLCEYFTILDYILIHTSPFLLEGEGMGTTFSISLPMQRIPQNVLDTIENNPAFGRYANPAVSRRISHDLLRSSQKVTSQKNASSKSNSNGPNGNLLLQNGPNLTDVGGGASCQPSDKDVRALAQRSTKSLSSHSHQQSSVGLMPSGRSICTTGRTPDGEKYHILVVDDSPLNRKMLSKLLKSKGHDIEEAADGQKGVDIVKQEADAGRNFDVILMDFVMPVMDGPTATRAIRAMHIKTPIFGLTGRFLRTA